ncbi:hypothetical protein ACQKJC_08910 [Priestia koreensis]
MKKVIVALLAVAVVVGAGVVKQDKQQADPTIGGMKPTSTVKKG